MKIPRDGRAELLLGAVPESIDSSACSERLREQLARPMNVGEVPDANGVGHEENWVCGDVMTVWIRVEDGVVAAAGYSARGCDPSLAAGGMITEMVKGRLLEEVLALAPSDIADAPGGLPPVRQHAAILAVRAVKKAVRDFESRD